jgi:serine/threonine protein kinase
VTVRRETQAGPPGVTLGAQLGRGGFGAVYAGRHLALDIDVAVKLIDPRSSDAAVHEQALREARLMARLDHPNLLRIHDAGRSGDFLYLVLELMDGGSLEGLRLAPPARLSELARQLLSGLQALHEARILHRDIKPANCLARLRDGRVKLADLGLAVDPSSSHDSRLAGTLPFMAPELFEGSGFDARTDLYALGLTLACFALGARPYPAGSTGEVMGWIMRGERPRVARERPELPASLTGTIDRLLSSRPESRPSSASEALAALTQDVRPEPAAAAEGVEDRIGPWLLGARYSASNNWHLYAVTHAQTARPARLAWLQHGGPLTGRSSFILQAATRASRLAHPGVLPVLDWGTRQERAYVVTAPQGRSLGELVASHGALPEVQALEFAVALADALAYLHEQRLVYQMLEPGTAHVSPDAASAQLAWPVYCVPVGERVLDDHGVAHRVVNPRFAAPETLVGSLSEARFDTSVDLYGLGEILFYLLAGRPAFKGENPMEVILAKGQPPDVRRAAPDLTQPTALLVNSLLDRSPARRPASASAVRDELARIAERLGGSVAHLLRTRAL